MSPWHPELFYHPATAASRPLLGSSACLLGENVRYDGAHKRQPHFDTELAPWLELQAICPEVGIGLGVPRPTLQLVSQAAGPAVVFTDSPQRAVTHELEAYADTYVAQLGVNWPLCGYIFKARSPSCGVGSTPINPGTAGETRGNGAFAGRIAARAPWLPLYEEDQLQDQRGCQDLLLHSFICQDLLWQDPEADSTALQAHYEERLQCELSAEPGNRLGLWVATAMALSGASSSLRKALLQRYWQG